MKPTVTLFALLATFTLCSHGVLAEDLQLRQEAIRLLERANAVSMAPTLPNLERTVTFRALDSAGEDGTFTRVVVQGTGRRDEITFRDYHVINVWTRGRLATNRTQELAPPEVAMIMRLTPIDLGRFDHEDVIDAITDSKKDDRPARCIEFRTVAGAKSDQNEICVDAANGTLLSSHVGNDLIENHDFFSFSGALLPRKIDYQYAGVPKLDITQNMTVLDNPTANVLAAPPNAQIRSMCGSIRRAFGERMPQPKPGSGGRDSEVLLRGIIGDDGKVHEAVVQSSEQSDHDAEALGLIRQWVFSPALCDGQPTSTEASFTLHFQGR